MWPEARPAQGVKFRVAPSRLPGRLRPDGCSSDVTRDPGCLEGGNVASRSPMEDRSRNIRGSFGQSQESPLFRKGHGCPARSSSSW
jgi:hypothetical protein